MAILHQTKLLLWKNFTLRRRQKQRLLVELVWPLFLFLILAWVRTRGLKYSVHECHFDAKALPSAGTLPFLYSFVCSFNNTCRAGAAPAPLVVLYHNMTDTLSDIAERLNTSSDRQLMADLVDVVLNVNLLREKLGTSAALISWKLGLDDVFSDESSFVQLLRKYQLGRTNWRRRKFYGSYVTVGSITSVAVPLLSRFVGNPTNYSLCDPSILQYVLMADEDIDSAELFRDICDSPLSQRVMFLRELSGLVDTNKVFNATSILFGDVLDRSVNVSQWSLTLQRSFTLLADVFNVQIYPRVMAGSGNWLRSIAEEPIDANLTTANPLVYALRLQESLCGINLADFLAPSVRDNQLPINQLRQRIRQQTSDESSVQDEPVDRCDKLFLNLELNPFSRLFWRALKPMVYGKIVYTPQNNATLRLMSRVNRTFTPFRRVHQFLNDWPSRVEASRPLLERALPFLDRALSLLRSLPVWESLDPVLGNISGMISPVAGEYFSINNSLLNFTEFSGESNLHKLNVSMNYIMSTSVRVSEYLTQLMACVSREKFIGVADEQTLVELSRNLSKDGLLWAGVIFLDLSDQSDQLPAMMRYKIRMDGDRVDSTKRIMDRLTRLGPRQRPYSDLKYITYGFAYLQDMVDRAIIEELTGQTVNSGVFLHQMPYPCYIDDKFILAISRTFPMFMVLAWVYSSAMIVKSIVYEKEQRLREIMLILGLNGSVHWLCWFITSFVLMCISDLMLTFILIFGNVLEHSNPLIVFIFLLCYSVATISFSFLLSTFFSRANLAAAAGGIIFFISYLPYPFLVIWEDRLSALVKWSGCLLSNVAFGFGCSYFAHYEERGIGIQWSTIDDSPLLDDSFSLLKIMLCLLMDSVIYLLLTFYIDAVFPGQYGLAQPWYFLCCPSYWSCFGSANKVQVKLDSEDTGNEGCSETEPSHLPLGVSIRHLKKTYSNGKTAVDNLSINFYQDQITSFLGHNGAGKTTTISILTGLLPATEGSVHIYGLDINEHMEEIRKSLGVCPQYNTLFDDLTVYEHLLFYARLKCGSDRNVKTVDLQTMVQDLGLVEKRDELSKNLSGGMQRKLSLGIAFIGGSRTVVLDEPTSGVDPFSRRSIWELLLKYKKGRVVILTTHFMDEADVLGDRIAIVSGGKLQCSGSSIFLKRQFGSGYYLTLVKSEHSTGPRVVNNNDEELSELSAPPSNSANGMIDVSGFSVERVTEFVRGHVDSAELLENFGSEITYMLPDDSGLPGQISSLLDDLDSKMVHLGIANYGLSDSPLEEIFLKLADGEFSHNPRSPRRMTRGRSIPLLHLSASAEPEHQLQVRHAPEQSVAAPNTAESADSEANRLLSKDGLRCCFQNGIPRFSRKVTFPLYLTHFIALCTKRFNHTRRNTKGLLFELVLPGIFVCLAMFFTLILPPLEEEPPLSLSPWLYEQPLNVFFSNEKPTSQLTNLLEHEFVNGQGMGTRCVASPELCKLKNSSNELYFQSSRTIPSNYSCSCSTGSMVCSGDTSKFSPAPRRLSSGDLVFNVTGYNVSLWLVKTRPNFFKKRWGGFTFGFTNPTTAFKRTELTEPLGKLKLLLPENRDDQLNWLRSIDIKNRTAQYFPPSEDVEIWYNNKGWATPVSYLSAFNSMLLRSRVPSNERKKYGIEVISHPLNFTKLQLRREIIKQSGVSLLHAICVIFAMSFVPASFTLYLIEERQSQSKHVQFVSGLSPLIYWISEYVWDMMNYLVSAALCILIFVAFNEQAYVSERNFPGLVALLVLYGWASISNMYPVSFLFQVPASAFVTLACANLFIGIVTTVATFVLEIFDDDELQYIAGILKKVFLVFPHYCLGRGLMDMAANQIRSEALSSFGFDSGSDLFDWDFLGRNLISMAGQGFIGLLITLAIEFIPKWFGGFRRYSGSLHSDEEAIDQDVLKERHHVLSGNTEDSVLRIAQLTKIYRKKNRPAVDRLCLSVKPAECFGLLGVNGAGKTSTFKMLTGQTRASSGDAFVCGYSVSRQLSQLRQRVGYCPQFDALDPLLTAREHLEFYARLRGVPPPQLQAVVAKMIERLGLTPFADRTAGTYSGGNKRKLSTAMSLIGDPPLVLLDEPTTGMDPKSRRFLWSCITDIVREGRSVILTSHSMEECEALCTRIAIMVNGQFKCLGSVQHLKSRFGDGYTVIVRTYENRREAAQDRVIEEFPSARVRDTHHLQIQFHFPSHQLKLSLVFRLLEKLRREQIVEDYSMSQTTLDDVFIRFAAEQTEIARERIESTVSPANSARAANRRSTMELEEIQHSKDTSSSRPENMADEQSPFST